MKVTLLRYTPDADAVIASAARLCYAESADAEKLMADLTPEQIDKFVEKLAEMGHQSPFEHVSFTFSVKGVSRALLAQISRHRLLSLSVRSQRYCDESRFDYVIPDSIAADDRARIKFKGLMGEIGKLYQEYVDMGIRKEDARAILPNACQTSFVMTVNAREFMHLCRLRLCTRAQKEIRTMVGEMLKLVQEKFPVLFRHAGAACDTMGYCPEGRMSCGRAPTLDKLLQAYRKADGKDNIRETA